ncbi:MAG: hypothetical protein JWO10_535 [Microbacteriaceae bacterium]|nr:hypothetical protein [Microbacteriaceae bacterium]
MTAGLPERLVEFVGALRANGVNSGTSETIDAADVIGILGMDDRPRLREGLSAALVRREGQREVFDATFDIYFPSAVGRSTGSIGAGDDISLDELREQLAAALDASDRDDLRRLAGVALDRFGQVGDGSQAGGVWSSYQALNRVAPQTLLAGVMKRKGLAANGDAADGRPVDERLAADETRELIAEFRSMVAAEAVRRMAEVRGRERMAKYTVPKRAEQVEFLTANALQLEQLRRTVRPLARRLATRLAAKRRRRNRGRIDVRKTIRRSMSTGGVPMRPAFEKPRPTRPELVLLCDVSGSVSAFSNFTMLLVQAMKGEFSRIRVFAFVNAMAEVTHLIDDDSTDLAARIVQEAEVARWHGSSDYGQSFAGFVADHLHAVTSRTSVLVLGDARNNYGEPRLDAFRQLAARSRRTFWLNPERVSSWGIGDSVAIEYGTIAEMHECRTVEQLSHFISRLLPV